ncbi:hypothetical protein FOMPIDRAFT_117926 [Fomitopsis schrenkii]|uniref:Uncharacterized protein n=1 Tax=Fomitopsis schrenkii TaxID=2126942 RepID=S8EBZ7_FOMSC|nr:hypothetical protein FOMPIDRAFT_117926 [Fomitopsis schrenkii]
MATLPKLLHRGLQLFHLAHELQLRLYCWVGGGTPGTRPAGFTGACGPGIPTAGGPVAGGQVNIGRRGGLKAGQWAGCMRWRARRDSFFHVIAKCTVSGSYPSHDFQVYSNVRRVNLPKMAAMSPRLV